jgi:hypothetical protein
MGLVGGIGKSRGLTWRVLLPIVVAAPLVGVLVVQVVGAAGAAPAAVTASSVAARPAVDRSAGTDPSSVSSAPRAASDPVSLDVPAADSPSGATPSPSTAFVADPSTEAQVAQDIMIAIDGQSKGAYDIVASPANVTLLQSWMANEGGLWADNPLNTSLDAGRYPHQFTSGGSDTGIPIYPDIQIGIAATATTLLMNRAYASILAVLDQNTGDCASFARAVIDSPWAASHYGQDPARFCGPSAGSGPVPGGPVVTACLRLPHGGKRWMARAERVPGTCGRFGAHATRTARMAHRTGAAHAAARHGASGHRTAVPHSVGHERPTTHGAVHTGGHVVVHGSTGRVARAVGRARR